MVGRIPNRIANPEHLSRQVLRKPECCHFLGQVRVDTGSPDEILPRRGTKKAASQSGLSWISGVAASGDQREGEQPAHDKNRQSQQSRSDDIGHDVLLGVLRGLNLQAAEYDCSVPADSQLGCRLANISGVGSGPYLHALRITRRARKPDSPGGQESVVLRALLPKAPGAI